MTLVMALAGAHRFTPDPDEHEQPFWRSASEGKLAVQRCGDCEHLVFPPSTECDLCLSDELEYEVLSGEGTVHSAGVVRSPILPGLNDHLPVVCALVAIHEDPDVLVTSNIVGVDDPADVAVGTTVKVVFDHQQPYSLPLFTVAERAHD